MLLTFTGTDSAFVENGFFDSNGVLDDPPVLNQGPNGLSFSNPSTGYITTISGFGFVTDNFGDVIAGTVTNVSFSRNNVVQGSMSNLSWGIEEFVLALFDIDNGSFAALIGLIERTAPTQINAANAQAGIDTSVSLEPILTGLSQSVIFTGSAFDDTITGGAGNDTLDGRAGNDLIINAGGGRDRFVGGAGRDTLFTDVTGVGNADVLLFDMVNGIHGRANSDLGRDTIDGVENFHMQGSWDVRIIGNSAQSLFRTSAGDDTVDAGGGDDTVHTAGGDDSIDGGAGIDTMVIDTSRGSVSASGSADDFTLTGFASGNDTVSNVEFIQFSDQLVATADLFVGIEVNGDEENNTLEGSSANDTIVGGRGDDNILAGEGNDDIRGDGGEDTILAGGGDDTIRGGREADVIDGGAGDDVIRSQRDGDTVFGGAGDDNIKSGGGNDLIFGEDGNDFLKGGTRRDTIEGGAGNDNIAGNSFDDSLSGGDGNDTIRAGGDNDTLDGGAGNDFLKGGGGADVFVFDLEDGRDRVTDFNVDEDILQFSLALVGSENPADALDFASVVGGNVAFDFVGDGSIVVVVEGIDNTDALADSILVV